MSASFQSPTELPAPPLQISQWLNLPAGRSLQIDELRGRVIVLHAFQMLCPGCVSHGLPQAQRISEFFDQKDVVVLGIHTVFEHHEAMTPTALAAFIHEYRWSFPIGIDTPSSSGPTPQTMQAYALRGTPSLVLIDRQGKIRCHWFGRPGDLEVGAAITTLVLEGEATVSGNAESISASSSTACDESSCPVHAT